MVCQSNLPYLVCLSLFECPSDSLLCTSTIRESLMQQKIATYIEYGRPSTLKVVGIVCYVPLFGEARSRCLGWAIAEAACGNPPAETTL